MTDDPKKEDDVWFCRTDVYQKDSFFWVYVVQNCDDGVFGLEVDMPDLPLGTCQNPQAPGCYLATIEFVKNLPKPGFGGYSFIRVKENLQEKFASTIREAANTIKRAEKYVNISELHKIDDI